MISRNLSKSTFLTFKKIRLSLNVLMRFANKRWARFEIQNSSKIFFYWIEFLCLLNSHLTSSSTFKECVAFQNLHYRRNDSRYKCQSRCTLRDSNCHRIQVALQRLLYLVITTSIQRSCIKREINMRCALTLRRTFVTSSQYCWIDRISFRISFKLLNYLLDLLHILSHSFRIRELLKSTRTFF